MDSTGNMHKDYPSPFIAHRIYTQPPTQLAIIVSRAEICSWSRCPAPWR
ncbi:MAG: hypothetical protein IPH17_06655 [Bacteroidales bacterium]|nr:hypothetical protein [Bacteroidales bacterium]